jgi:hypothetical protein
VGAGRGWRHRPTRAQRWRLPHRVFPPSPGLCHHAPPPARPLHTRAGGLGEILEGNDLQNSDIAIHFKTDVDHAPVCQMALDEQAAQLMAFAVSNHYWYQMFVDELPVWGMVGEIVADEDVIQEIESHIDRPHGIAESTFLYTHKNFTIGYNGDRVIEVNMTSEGAVPIEAGHTYDLTYSVHWVEMPDRSFERRFDRYLDNNFFEHQIHWFSLFNSFMMVVFLCGLVALILMRTLKADYARYMRDEEDGEAGAFEKGAWCGAAPGRRRARAAASRWPCARVCAVSVDQLRSSLTSSFAAPRPPPPPPPIPRAQAWATTAAGSRCTATCSASPRTWTSTPLSWARARS